MRIVNSLEFQTKYMMKLKECEEDFAKDFPQLDLEQLGEEIKVEFLINTRRYYLSILKKFKEYVDLDTTVFKELRVLKLNEAYRFDPTVWQPLSIRFSYLYNNNHSCFKKELSDFLELDFSQFIEENSVLQWKKIKDMKRGQELRFPNLIRLIEGLISIPYSNASIERAFNHLKLTKNKQRLKLKANNLASFMILKNLTRKNRVQDFDGLLSTCHLKKVKTNIDDQVQKKCIKQK